VNDPDYQRKFFEKRYAEDPQFRRRHRYATDPEYRARECARCARANRKRRLESRYGISIDAYEAVMARQRGACAACDEKLGRIVRIDQCPDTGRLIALLCTECANDVATLRHVLAYATGFEAYFERWEMAEARGRQHRLVSLFSRRRGAD
jgi:hypothetical protein